MNKIIEQFRTELLEIALYSDDTVSNYISCVYKFSDYIKQQFEIEPEKTTPQHIRQWMAHLKKTGISNSRMNHHHSALTGFFTFLEKINRITDNPTDGLFPLRRTKSDLNQPIDTDTAYKLLKSVDRTKWIGQRDFTLLDIKFILFYIYSLFLLWQFILHLSKYYLTG